MSVPQRRRLVTTAAAVSAIAFGVGWMLGRSATDPGAAGAEAPGASTTPFDPTVPAELAGSTLPSVDPGLFAPSTTPATGWTFGSADVDRRAAALGVRIVGVRPGLVLQLDTATGDLAELEVAARYRQPPHVEAGEDWILVRRTDISYAQLFRGQEQPIALRLGYATNAFARPGTDRLWRVLTADERNAPTRVVEIDHEGVESGVAFEFDGPDALLGIVPGAVD